MIDNNIFTDFKVQTLVEEKTINYKKVLSGKNFYLIKRIILKLITTYVPDNYFSLGKYMNYNVFDFSFM